MSGGMRQSVLYKANIWNCVCRHSVDNPGCYMDCRECIENNNSLEKMLLQLEMDKSLRLTAQALLFVCETHNGILVSMVGDYVSTLDMKCPTDSHKCSSVFICIACKLGNHWYICDTDGIKYNIDSPILEWSNIANKCFILYNINIAEVSAQLKRLQ